MSIIGDITGIASSIAAAGGAKKKNQALAQQYTDQQGYANQQTGIANTIRNYLASLSGTSAGSYVTPLTAPQQAVQDSSYGEELNRDTVDQTQRRTALQDTERLRQQTSGENDQSLRDLDAARAGVGKIDPVALANTMRLNRTAAVNAGYDDAAHAAQSLSLRTGTSAGDALAEIARNRVKDIAATVGDPETDALTTAQTYNNNVDSSKASMYNLFNTKANNFYDSAFTPSTYAQTAKENAQKDQALDLTKYDTLFGGATNQGALVGNAASGLRQASGIKNSGTDYNILGQLISGVGKGTDALATDIASAAGGGGFSLKNLFGG